MEVMNFLFQRLRDTWTMLSEADTGIAGLTWSDLIVGFSILSAMFSFAIAFIKGEQMAMNKQIGDNISKGVYKDMFVKNQSMYGPVNRQITYTPKKKG